MNEENGNYNLEKGALRLKLVKRIFILGFSALMLILPFGTLSARYEPGSRPESSMIIITLIAVIAIVIGIGIFTVGPVLLEYRSYQNSELEDKETEMFP